MRALFWCLTLLVLLPDCGGAGPAATEVKSAADGEKGSSLSTEGASEGVEAEESARPRGSANGKPTALNCDDGGCSPCGDGICPKGWYCDEKAGGGAACSWLPECADKPTCNCVRRVLGANCKCASDDRGLKVSCE